MAVSTAAKMTRPRTQSASSQISSAFGGERGGPSTQQARTYLSILSKEELDTEKKNLEAQGKQLEFVGYHGTARWAFKNIKQDGFDVDIGSKYRGTVSGGGAGCYTTSNKDIAHHYARRASLGEPDAFDKDTKPVVFAVYRKASQTLTKVDMPPEILGKPELVEKFRSEHPADEYQIGPTPVPRRLKGATGTTTLISGQGLKNEEIGYYGIEVEPDEGKK